MCFNEYPSINSNEPLFYPYSVKISKCSGSWNNINDLSAKLCVPDAVFNLMSQSNETRHIKWHEAGKCKCRLDRSVCNNKKSWKKDKCRFECKELIDKGSCDKGFIWNPGNCDCKCDKLCDVGKYLEYKSCKCRKSLIDKLFEECSENSDENKMIHNGTLNDYKKVCSSCTVYIVLFAITFLIIIGISCDLIYFHWYLKSGTCVTNINPGAETIIYWTYKWEISNKLTLEIENITLLMIWSILKTLICTF